MATRRLAHILAGGTAAAVGLAAMLRATEKPPPHSADDPPQAQHQIFQLKKKPLIPARAWNAFRTMYKIECENHVIILTPKPPYSEELIYNDMAYALGLDMDPGWSQMMSGKTAEEKLAHLVDVFNAVDRRLVGSGFPHLVVILVAKTPHPNLQKHFMPAKPHSFRYIQSTDEGDDLAGHLWFAAMRQPGPKRIGMSQILDITKDIGRSAVSDVGDLRRRHGSVAADALQLLRKAKIVEQTTLLFTQRRFYSDAEFIR